MQHPIQTSTITISEYPLDDIPLDLAPRRLIAPRRRLRELSTDHITHIAPNLLINNEMIDESLNRVMTSMHAMSSDVEQPESPPVIIDLNIFKKLVFSFINNYLKCKKNEIEFFLRLLLLTIHTLLYIYCC